MRIAVVHTGLLRTAPMNFDSWRRFVFERHDCDVFLHAPTTYWASKANDPHWADADPEYVDQSLIARELRPWLRDAHYYQQRSDAFRQFVLDNGLPAQNEIHQDVFRMALHMYALEQGARMMRAYADFHRVHYDAIVFSRFDVMHYEPDRIPAVGPDDVFYPVAEGFWSHGERKFGAARTFGFRGNFNDQFVVLGDRAARRIETIWTDFVANCKEVTPNNETLYAHQLRKWRPNDEDRRYTPNPYDLATFEIERGDHRCEPLPVKPPKIIDTYLPRAPLLSDFHREARP